MTLLHPQGWLPSAADRLVRLGARLRAVPAAAPPRLDSQSSGDVYIVPSAAFGSAEWPKLRVGLARANRFFLVEIDQSTTSEVVHAMRDGAYDVLAVGDSDERWKTSLEQAAGNQGLWLSLYSGVLEADGKGGGLVGGSKTMGELRRDIERLGPTDVTVLVMGESGAGKERIAAALHAAAGAGPFVTMNCAAMPKDLLEAELFGVEKGAFTGALKSRAGLFEQAEGGAVFLDEIGELDISLQPKLLRFLETRKARRIGGEKEYSVRLRVISATNRDLETEVQAGRFRADLYYRLAEVVIKAPPLRDRADDIPALVRVFVSGANERFGKNVEGAEPALLSKLQAYRWPGNVRELKSAIDRLVLFHDGPWLREGWWDPPAGVLSVPPPSHAPEPASVSSAAVAAPDQVSGAFPGRSDRVELAKRLLAEGKCSLSEIAARSGVHPSTLFRWRQAGKL